jgi:flagellar biosynthetic protein FliR
MPATGGLELALGGGQVATLFLVLMRTTGLVVAAPILGHRAIPAPVKAGLAAVLAFALARGAAAAPGALPVLVAAPLELLIGLCLGLVLSLGFHAVELAGRLVSLQMGLSLGAVFSPTSQEGSTALDPFFSIFAGLLFLALNLHLAVVGALATSLRALPIGGGWPTDLWLLAGRMYALVLELGARIAMPLALVLLLTELAVALLARAIPQINVFILGLPLKIMVGIAVAAVAIPNLAAGATAIYRFLFDGVTTGIVR